MNKKKVLFINTVCGFGSTGKIVCELANSTDYDSLVCYGRHDYDGNLNSYKFANFFDNAFGAIRTILFDNNINICSIATRRLIKKIKEYDPDIIHLHNLHGYYLNVEMLFRFLKEYNKPVIWTLHDCWALTGYCPHFDCAKCEKYKTGCFDCQHKFSYPFSLFKQRVEKEYEKKKNLFNSLNDLTIVVPSNWLKQKVEESFINNCKIVVVPNGIDLSKSVTNEKYDDFTVLAVANYWTEEKGINELEKIIPLLDKNIQVILVGQLKNSNPVFDRCRKIDRTNNYDELIELYSKSHLLINPSLEDVFGLVNVEAQSCGTPVVAYNTGGIPETIFNKNNIIEKYDYLSFSKRVNQIYKKGLTYNECCFDLISKFDIKDMKQKYIEIYNHYS